MKTLRPVTAVLAAALLVGLASCTRDRAGLEEVAGPFLSDTFAVLDDFEVESPWSVESAENHGLIEYVSQMFTSGERALKVTAFKMGRFKTAIRKEVDYDLTHVRKLKLDIFNAAGEPIDFAFAFKVVDGSRYFETVSFKLKPGANEGLVFPLNARTFKPLYGKQTYEHWLRGRPRVIRIGLVFFEGERFRNEFYVDNLRCDRPFQMVDRGMRPRIINVLPSAATVGICRRFEIDVDFEGAFSDPFDRQDVSVWANVRAPSRKHERIEGFLGDYDKARDKFLWKIRYSPREFGEHAFDVFVRTRKGEVGTGPFTFRVVEDGAPGFVRVSETDPTAFEHSRGLFFYPFGQNVCWASDYEYFFRKIHDYGGNWARVWMCPWNLFLEGKNGPGIYDLDVAEELDRVVELAEQYGIYLQLVFDYHAIVGNDWGRNPYNVDNGGWCTMPQDFWRHGEALRFYRKRLDYIVARWGASQNILAWELFNEADLTTRAHDDDVVNWHKQMAAHIKRIDPYDHLVTTSTVARNALTKLWALPEIDYVQSHFYTPRVFHAVPEQWFAKRIYRKPYVVGEFGRGGQAHQDQVDPDGILLSATLWLAATTPAAGNAMPWWWDTHIDPNDLYGRFAAVARFLDGEDRRNRHDEFFQRRLRLAEGNTLWTQGIANRTSAFVYLFDPERILRPEQGKNHPAIPQSVLLALDGMLGGPYRVELWAAESGEVLSTQTITAGPDGKLEIGLPASDEPLAVKVKREGDSQLHLDIHPQ